MISTNQNSGGAVVKPISISEYTTMMPNHVIKDFDVARDVNPLIASHDTN